MIKRYIPLIAGILLSLFSQNLQAAQTSIVVIVDASWAMSLSPGKEAPPPIEILKGGMINLISSLNDSTLLGMIISGNTEETGCSAPFVELPPVILDETNRNLYKNTIQNLNPQGELSLSKAMSQAISTLTSMETENRIILVVGRGEESCSFSPCEDMKRIFPKDMALSVHAISINGSGETAKSQMACLARNGNGLWFNASTVADVDMAVKEILAGVSSNLKVYVTLSKGNPFSGNLKATLFRSNETKGGYQEYLGHPAFFSALPGQYRLTLECTGNQLNVVKEMNDISVPETGQKTIDVDLELGRVDISVNLCGNRATPQKLLTHVFRSDNKDEEIGQSDRVPLSYYLAPGTYDFLMEIDHFGFKETLRSEKVSVISGKKSYRSFNLNLGELVLTAYVNQNEIYKGPARLTVFPTGVKDRPVLSTDAHQASLYLPQGSYDLLFEMKDQASSQGVLWKNKVSVVAGEKASEFINLSFGELKCTIHTGSSEEAASPVKSQIFRSGTEEAPVYETDQNPFNLQLSAGMYDIRTEYTGTIEPISVLEKAILVIPGQTAEKKIDLGLKKFEVHFYSESDLEISEFVSTTLYKKGVLDRPLTTLQSGPINLILPMGEYDLKFEVTISDRKKTFWRKNVAVTSDPIQSFSVSFPDF